MVKSVLGWILFSTSILFFCGCNREQQSAVLHTDFGENEVSCAVGFTLQRKGDVVRIAVKGDSLRSLATYYLVKDTATVVPTDGIKVLVPIKRMVSTSTTHYEPIVLLDELKSVVGICNPERTYNPIVRAAFEKKVIANLGDSYTLNREQLLEIHPDAILTSRYAATDPATDALAQAGYLLLYNQEWQEQTLLGRAEWLKFIAAFYDKLPLADSLFSATTQSYRQLQAKAAKVHTHPKVMSGCGFHGTWYVPGGKSYMAELYQSAGGDYVYAADGQTGSLPLNLEAILADFSDADYWFGVQEKTKKDVLAVEPRVSDMKSVKSGLIFNFNKRCGEGGSSDFWEGAVSHPDWLLADVIAVLHPDILPNHQFVYLEQVK